MKNKFSLARFLLIIPLLAAFLAGTMLPVQAAVIDEDGIIEANQVIDDDVFISADTVTVDGTVNGALLAAGRLIVINGKVNGDVILMGNNIVISDTAEIDGNVFSGGKQITLNGKVSGSVFSGGAELYLKDGVQLGRNLYFGGYQLSTAAETAVDRDVYAATYQSILNGSVTRNVNIAAAAVELNGKVGNDVTLDVASPDQQEPVAMQSHFYPDIPQALQPGVRISKNAVIGGKLVYTSASEQSQQIAVAPQGGIIYQTPVPSSNETPAHQRTDNQPAASEMMVHFGSYALDITRSFFTLLVLGALALWLMPATLQKSSALAQNKPGHAIGLGFLVIFAGYLAALLITVVLLIVVGLFSLITLGGLSATLFGVGFSGLTFVMTVFTLIVTYGSKLVVAYLIGSLIIHKLAPQASRPEIWGLVIGVLLYAIFQAIPFFGFLINILITAVGVGAIWLYYTERKPAAEIVENTPAA